MTDDSVTVDTMVFADRISSELVAERFRQAVADAERLSAGKAVEGETGLLGESGVVLPYAILKFAQHGEMPEGAEEVVAEDAHVRLLRGILSGLTTKTYIDGASLIVYGFLLGEFTDEEMRHAYRLTLNSSLPRAAVDTWLRRAVILLGVADGLTGRALLSRVREWIEFLGAPLWSPEDLAEPCEEMGVDISSCLADEDLRFVAVLKRHTAYLEEALQGRTYQQVRSLTREWLPDAISREILGIFREQMAQQAQDVLSPGMTIEAAVDAVRDLYDREDFKSHDGHVLPVRLQDLPQPPAPEAIDPVVFEMIPDKMRVQLMPAIVYSTAPKRVEILFIGGPRIGHSGIIIKTDCGGVLLDFGLSVANQQIPSWEPEVDMVDSVLISHAHLDHVGGLPILYDKYDGRWCSTGLTAAITKMLLEDALAVGTPSPPRRSDRRDLISRFTKKNIDTVIKNHVKLEVGKSSEVGGGIVVTPIDASHVPGSVAYVIDVEGFRILYTGDFNLDPSAILPGAALPTDTDVIIFDGTYWGREDFDRVRVYGQVTDIVNNYGPIIIPAFAVGRSQEMLTILDQIGASSERNIIVAGLAEKVTKMTGFSGAWEGIKKNKVVLEREDILVSGGGMLNGGPAKQHFEEHRENPEAAVILCGYLAPRTPGWNLLYGFEPHLCRVEYARLSAHSSSSRLGEFIRSCTAKKIMVHTPAQGAPDGVLIPAPSQRLVFDL